MPNIRVVWSQGSLVASLRDTATAQTLLAALPIESRASTWGDEVYFRVPFSARPEPDATAVVEKGSVCFWLDGDSIALLFGPTPVSKAGECRLISPANIVGMIDGNPDVLRSVANGDTIRIESI
jgi:hypothetical protein